MQATAGDFLLLALLLNHLREWIVDGQKYEVIKKINAESRARECRFQDAFDPFCAACLTPFRYSCTPPLAVKHPYLHLQGSKIPDNLHVMQP